MQWSFKLFVLAFLAVALVDCQTTRRSTRTSSRRTTSGGSGGSGSSGTVAGPGAGPTIAGTTGDPNFGQVSQAAKDQWTKIKDSCCRIVEGQYEIVDPGYCARQSPVVRCTDGVDFCAVSLPLDPNAKITCKPMPASCSNPSSASCGVSAGGACKETNPRCCEWAKCGECDKNPFYMKVQCCKTCGTAGATVYDVDSFPTKVDATCSSTGRTGGGTGSGDVSSVSTVPPGSVTRALRLMDTAVENNEILSEAKHR